MNFESYTKLYENYGDGKILRADGVGAKLNFEFNAVQNKKYRLFTVGQTGQFYQWKNEPDMAFQYTMLADSLDTEHAVRSQYALNMSSKKPEEYIKRLYKKVLWPPRLSYLKLTPVGTKWEAGLYACAKGLKVEKGGYLRMNIEIRLKKEGKSIHSNILPPDKTVTLDIAEGSYGMTRLSKMLEIDPDATASVGVWIEGKLYSGELFIECPFLNSETGFNLLPDFSLTVQNKEHFIWLGQHFSRKEWPEFRVTLNGEKIFEGEIFERCHTDSEWETEIPAHLLKKNNTLEYELISDYKDPLPYCLAEVGIIERNSGNLVLISASENVKIGEKGYILLRTEQNGLKVTLDIPTEYIDADKEYTFEEAGLHAIPIKCKKAGHNIPFTLSADGTEEHGVISRIVSGSSDGVITGTGDMVYIQQTVEDTEEYLAWYLSNHIGNLITVRPVYRWAGSRTVNPKVWKIFTRVLNECGIKYSHMMDGREPTSLNTNPDMDMMAGEGFLGQQTHEYDGCFFYGGGGLVNGTLSNEQYADMFMRVAEEDAPHTHMRYRASNFTYDCGDNVYMYKDPFIERDMRTVAQHSTERLANGRVREARHTGPSVMFKYFLEAGYKWVGLETMYGTMEINQAFLRGVQKSYGLPATGVHHALQWSSSPYDVPEHIRRYRLALYVSYMQGADEINTEEGLWRIEEYYSHYHRFSNCCNRHKKQQLDFYRYVSTHTRAGSFYTPMALIHGRYDGWVGFGSNNMWGLISNSRGLSKGTYGDAENSWKLMKVFYPLSKPGNAIYIHNCPTNEPIGYHTGTPLGNVDAVPIEKNSFNEYKTAAFMGYNCAEAEDISNLESFVRNGGKLLLTMAHLTTTTNIEKIRGYNLEFLDTQLTFCNGKPEFEVSTVNGIEAEVCTNSLKGNVLAFTDNGYPLVTEYSYGDGTVTMFNAKAYPAHPAIRELYEKELKRHMTEATDSEDIWVYTGDDVETAVYKTENGETHIYALAVDWYRDPKLDRNVTVRVGDTLYQTTLKFGTMIKFAAKNSILAFPDSEDGEILEITDSCVTVQGTGKVNFSVCKDGNINSCQIDFKNQTTAHIEY